MTIRRLSAPARSAIATADVVVVSAASTREAAIKTALGRLTLPRAFGVGVDALHLLLGLLVVTGCGRARVTEAPMSARPSSSAPAEAPPSTPASSETAAPPSRLTPFAEWKPGETVTVRGRVSKVPAQHIMTSVEGKKSDYFDVDDHQQTIVYWADAPTCSGDVELTGVVVEVKGPGKAPPGSKAYTHRELQLDVQSARCV